MTEIGYLIYYVGNPLGSVIFSLIGCCYFDLESYLPSYEPQIVSLITFFSLIVPTWILILLIQQLWPIISKLLGWLLGWGLNLLSHLSRKTLDFIGFILILALSITILIYFPKKIRLEIRLLRRNGEVIKSFTCYKHPYEALKPEDLPTNLNRDEIRATLSYANNANFSSFFSADPDYIVIGYNKDIVMINHRQNFTFQSQIHGTTRTVTFDLPPGVEFVKREYLPRHLNFEDRTMIMYHVDYGPVKTRKHKVTMPNGEEFTLFSAEGHPLRREDLPPALLPPNRSQEKITQFLNGFNRYLTQRGSRSQNTAPQSRIEFQPMIEPQPQMQVG